MHSDPPLTLAQRAYLESFDRFLLAKRFSERASARAEMGVRLNFVMSEVSAPPPRWPARLARRP